MDVEFMFLGVTSFHGDISKRDVSSMNGDIS